jgi:hypothetical protein
MQTLAGLAPLTGILGILVGHVLTRSSQQKQWLRERKLEEFRDLLSALANYFTEEIALESNGRAEGTKDREKLDELKTILFRVMRSRIFIAHDIEMRDLEGRWQDALIRFQKTAEVKVFVAAYDEVVQEIVGAATRTR